MNNKSLVFSAWKIRALGRIIKKHISGSSNKTQKKFHEEE